MKAYLENTKKILFDRNDLTQCQEVVERFVNKITINYDGILIDFIFGLEDVDKMVVPTRSIFISTSVSRKEIYNYSGRIAGDIDE
jgi:poly(A) polymerase Pap1